MKKKLVSILLTISMALSLGACGSGSNKGNESSNESIDNASDASVVSDVSDANDTSDDEVYNVIMQIVTFGTEFTGLSDVEEAINAITVPEIGVSVTLVPVAAWDLKTTSSLAVTSNEKLDLMCILPMGSGMDSISNYTGKNMLNSLNGLYDEYGKDIQSCIGELVKIGYSGENLYAIPANYYAGSGGGYLVRTAAMQELGYDFNEEQIYSLSDLEPMFADYKAKYGDGYYSIAGLGAGDDFTSMYAVDDMGSNGAYGSILNGGIGNTTVVNKFASDEYSNFSSQMHEWFTSGYLNPDVATITDAWSNLLATGNYLGTFTTYAGMSGMDSIIVNEQTVGEDLTCIKLVEDYATTGIASYGMWAIPVTCENPEKTMQFLNLLYQDRDRSTDIDTLLACGIEGKTYQVVEDLGGSKAIVDFVDGVDRTTAPYMQQVPIYGNEFNEPLFAPLTADLYDQLSGYNQSIQDAKRYSDVFGYSFDSTNVSSQVAAIANVIAQYRPLLSWGTVDPDEVLPEFLNALEAAGINDVIKENQSQIDTWLALQ